MADKVPIYGIAKWRETFETADSRKHKALSWVSWPIDCQSSGYQSLIDSFPDNPESIYGAWCALVGIAAGCPERGVLANSKGQPLSIQRIARMTHMSESSFLSLFTWAASEEVQWLVVVSHVDRLPTSQQSIDDQSVIELPNPTQQDPTQPNKPNTTKISESNKPPKGDTAVIQDFFDRWNRFATRTPKITPCRKLTDKRREKIKARLKDPDWIQDLREAIKSLPLPGDGWQPNLDWVIRNEHNVYLILEGTYDWRGKDDPASQRVAQERRKNALKERTEREEKEKCERKKSESQVRKTIDSICSPITGNGKSEQEETLLFGSEEDSVASGADDSTQ